MNKGLFYKGRGFLILFKIRQGRRQILFLIFSADRHIIGESVINEIDWQLRCVNFRICIFRPDIRGKGVGTWATKVTCDFAFEHLKLHRLELNVFSFNPHAQRAYLKAGFKKEGILWDAVLDGDQYADDILMAILEDDWKNKRKQKDKLEFVGGQNNGIYKT